MTGFKPNCTTTQLLLKNVYHMETEKAARLNFAESKWRVRWKARERSHAILSYAYIYNSILLGPIVLELHFH